MADIFISYAHADRAKVEQLSRALENKGFSVWIDRKIAGGNEFSIDIEKELDAAGAVIVAWTKDAAKSRWVKDEASIAADAGKLVAIRLDDAPPPIGFKQFQVVDYKKANEAALSEITRSVALKLGRQNIAAPAVASTPSTSFADRHKKIAAISAALVVIAAAAFWIVSAVTQQSRETVPEIIADSDDASSDGAPANYKSIAVLAFADLSPDQNQEYFSDGVAEELLNVLARNTNLKVAARTSSFSFKDSKETVSSIGAALNVDAVLEGSVRKAGDKVRVTAQLIDARSGFHLWSATYDRNLVDIFAVQDEIANAIVRALPAIELRNAAATVMQANSEAYDLYLQGRYQMAQRTGPSLKQALALFEQSVAADPQFALAWADLAMSALLLVSGFGTYGDLTGDEAAAIAEPAINKALALNPALAEAFSAQGFLRTVQGDVDGAIAVHRKAIGLNPNVANSRHMLSLMLFRKGAFREFFEVIDEAVEIDPLAALTLNIHTQSLIYRGRYRDALAAAKRLANLHPDWPLSTEALASAYAANGQFAEAAIYFLDAAEASDGMGDIVAATSDLLIRLKLFDHPFYQSAPIFALAVASATDGRHAEARALALEFVQAHPQSRFANGIALWTLWATGEDAEALAMAEKIAALRDDGGSGWAVWPADCTQGLHIAGLLRPTGDESRFQRIVSGCRIALDDAAAQGFVLAYDKRDMNAQLLVLEGRHDEALNELRALTDSGLFINWWLDIEPIYRPLYDDPRFIEIVKDLNARVDAEREKFLALSQSESGSGN